jgi:hypothetical protein
MTLLRLLLLLRLVLLRLVLRLVLGVWFGWIVLKLWPDK